MICFKGKFISFIKAIFRIFSINLNGRNNKLKGVFAPQHMILSRFMWALFRDNANKILIIAKKLYLNQFLIILVLKIKID
jgi:hypothetical protein